MTTKMGWGILGTGMIAKRLAKAIAESNTGELIAVGSRNQDSAEKFGNEFNVPAAGRYGSYEQVLADPKVHAVYISLPNHMHAQWSMKCADAGKHILCEKPLGSNQAQAMAMTDYVQRKGVFLLEAFMYRCHPQTAKIVELVKSKVIGDVRVIHCFFSFDFGEQPDNIRSKASLSGGGIMDVGCYTTSMARLIAGAALGLDGPAEPLSLSGHAHIHQPGNVDTYATATVKFPGEILANLTCGMQCNVWQPTAIYGSKGRIVIHNPWFPGTDANSTKIEVFVNGESEPRVMHPVSDRDLYAVEVDLLAEHVAKGQQQAKFTAMNWADSINNMKMLDQWRASIGVSFDCEKLQGMKQVIGGGKLKVRQGARIPMGEIPHLKKPVSKIILGTMWHVVGPLPKTFAMLDHFFQSGGNTLDCAQVYGSEDRVGQWVNTRKVREQMVIIGKGAATVEATPQMLDEHIKISLDRFGFDYLDVYMMHRDNVKVPVGEFVDVFNQHKKKGHIKAFGGSNWSIERLQAANDYAKKKKLQGFSVSSPNFSLAHWNEPMWGDCVNAVDPLSRAWYTATQLPLLAWSSQANGFFSGRFKREDASKPELREIVRVWFNDGNFRRLERVNELARKYNCSPLQISLAYVLGQSMNMYALIGPETFEEMNSSLQALSVNLSAEDIAYLDIREEEKPLKLPKSKPTGKRK